MKIKHWRIVSYAPDHPQAIFATRHKATIAMRSHVGADTWAQANTRVYAYRSRRSAKNAVIHHVVGEWGRVS